MHVHHCLAGIELRVHRRECSVAEILVLIAGEEGYSVGLERVERVRDLPEASLRFVTVAPCVSWSGFCRAPQKGAHLKTIFKMGVAKSS